MHIVEVHFVGPTIYLPVSGLVVLLGAVRTKILGPQIRVDFVNWVTPSTVSSHPRSSVRDYVADINLVAQLERVSVNIHLHPPISTADMMDDPPEKLLLGAVDSSVAIAAPQHLIVLFELVTRAVRCLERREHFFEPMGNFGFAHLPGNQEAFNLGRVHSAGTWNLEAGR